MGRRVLAAALDDPSLDVVGAWTHARSRSLGQDIGALSGRPLVGRAATALDDSLDRCRVVIDFSLPEGTAELVERAGDQALVVGTTGLSPATESALRAHAARAPTLVASNFSTGVNVLMALVGQAAAALPDYDIEIVEMHHRHKRDAPSGTALALGRAAAAARGVDLDAVAAHGRSGETGERPVGQIAFHALRGGGVIGDHSVYLAGPAERVLLGHAATTRAAFALGALRAARWIADQPPGWYTMRDVLGI
jgi:4-hydroxy-tetrahydrodipicolinate reductase